MRRPFHYNTILWVWGIEAANHPEGRMDFLVYSPRRVLREYSGQIFFGDMELELEGG